MPVTRRPVRLYDLYARHLFPRLMEWAIGTEDQLDLRRETLGAASGRVLEVGFGTGLNLACYPREVESLTGGEAERPLEDRVRRRIAAAPFPVRRVRLDAARLPFRDLSFDTAVSTWTLCTIADPVRALREIHRVLTPDGRLLFMEHGRSDRPRVARWQDRLNPIERIVACGCNLNRRIDSLISEAGFEIRRLERFLLPKAPRVVGEVYRGRAAPNAAGARRASLRRAPAPEGPRGR